MRFSVLHSETSALFFCEYLNYTARGSLNFKATSITVWFKIDPLSVKATRNIPGWSGRKTYSAQKPRFTFLRLWFIKILQNVVCFNSMKHIICVIYTYNSVWGTKLQERFLFLGIFLSHLIRNYPKSETVLPFGSKFFSFRMVCKLQHGKIKKMVAWSVVTNHQVFDSSLWSPRSIVIVCHIAS